MSYPLRTRDTNIDYRYKIGDDIQNDPLNKSVPYKKTISTSTSTSVQPTKIDKQTSLDVNNYIYNIHQYIYNNIIICSVFDLE